MALGYARAGSWSLGHLRQAVFALVALLALLGLSPTALAFTPPALTGPVMDEAHVLAPADKARIAAKLLALQANNGPQVAVLTLSSLWGETVEDVSYKTAKTWKLGDARRDDGVLLLVATGERKIRIETGKGVGGDLTDLETNRIIRERIGPPLKAGNYAAGIEAGIDAIAAKLGRGTPGAAAPSETRQTVDTVANVLIPLFAALLIGLLLYVIIKNAKRGGGSSSSGGSWSSGSDSSSSSDSGGGSDYGGGGGDFGGGGSSGDY